MYGTSVHFDMQTFDRDFNAAAEIIGNNWRPIVGFCTWLLLALITLLLIG